MTLNEQQFNYRGQHRPPSADDSAPLHDIGSVLPDVYEHPEWYHFGDQLVDRESTAALFSARGKPSRRIKVYRGIGAGVEHGGTINPGDWVTTSRTYARQHAGEGGVVLSADVPAEHVRFGGNDFVEFGYHGDTVRGRRHAVKRIQ